MYIKLLAGTGIKGQAFEHKLTPRTIITGPAFSGKTARLGAIYFALLKYLPGNPPKRTNAAIADAFTLGSTLSARVLFNDGTMFERSLRREGTSVKGDGSEDTLYFPILDANGIFQMGPSERLAFLFARVKPPETFTRDAIVARVRNVTIDGDSSELLEASRNKIADDCKTSFDAAALQGLTINEAIANLTKKDGKLPKVKSFQKQRADETISFVRVASELRNRAGECSAETIKDIATEIEGLRLQRAEVEKRSGALSQRQEAADSTTKRRKLLTDAIAKPDAEPAPDPLPGLRVQLNTEEQREIAAPVGSEQEIEASLSDARSRVSIASSDVKRHEGQKATVLADIAKLDGMECCSFCKSKGKGWKVNLKASYETTLQQVEELLTSSAAAVENATRDQTAAALVLKEYRATRDAFNAHESAVREIKAKIKSAEDAKVRIAEGVRAAAELRATRQAELKALVDSAAPEPAEFERIDNEIVELDEKIDAAQARLDAANALATSIASAAESEVEHVKANALYRVASRVIEELKTAQDEMIAACIGGTINRANALFGDVLPSPLAFHEGELGRWEDHRFVKITAFSGSEEALAYMAFAAALSADAAARICIIDEFGRLDRGTQDKAVAALSRAVEGGQLDQVIIAAPELPEGDFHGWARIRTGEEA